MNDRPRQTLALAASTGTASLLAGFLARVGAGHDIVSWRRSSPSAVDAVVAADPAALASVVDSAAETGRTVPVCCRVESPDDAATAASAGAAVLLTGDHLLAVELGATPAAGSPPVVWVPLDGLDVAELPVVAPLTRDLLRSAHRLPERLVLAVEGAVATPDRTTSLALASAAVVDGRLLPLALALGTPSVTDLEAADGLGLTDGVEVVVAGSPREADRAAAALADDLDRSAALSRSARAFAEARLDQGGPSRRIRRLLGLAPPPSLIDLRLAELATPSTSRLRQRASAALEPFTTEPSR